VYKIFKLRLSLFTN